jgi:hypothetical protein
MKHFFVLEQKLSVCTNKSCLRNLCSCQSVFAALAFYVKFDCVRFAQSWKRFLDNATVLVLLLYSYVIIILYIVLPSRPKDKILSHFQIELDFISLSFPIHVGAQSKIWITCKFVILMLYVSQPKNTSSYILTIHSEKFVEENKIISIITFHIEFYSINLNNEYIC